ncbi:MAG: hypothetical protein AAF589_08215 [Planctomycetota bacterium]
MSPLTQALRRLNSSPDSLARKPPHQVSCAPQLAPAPEAGEIPHAGPPGGDALSTTAESTSTGSIALYADLVGDAGLVQQAVAESADVVFFVRPGAAPTGPTLHLPEGQPGEAALGNLPWPVPGQPRVVGLSSSATRADLPIGSAGMDRRAWVLFLDACRSAYDTASMIVPATSTQELAWLADRSDTANLLVHAGATTAEAARRAALCLDRFRGAGVACVVVKTQRGRLAA